MVLVYVFSYCCKWFTMPPLICAHVGKHTMAAVVTTASQAASSGMNRISREVIRCIGSSAGHSGLHLCTFQEVIKS